MQGGVLSPKLFNEFLQDLGKYLNPKCGLKIGDIYLAYLLFADDIVLFSEFAESLQAQIYLFYKYCEIWNLIISIAKTKIVIYIKYILNIHFLSHWPKIRLKSWTNINF